MLQKIIGQFTRDERLYDDEKIKNLAKRFPSENSPDGQRMIMYMLLFSWYTRNTVLPFTADQIVSLVDSIIDVYYNQEYQQMNNIMISLIRNDLQRMSFWSNEYVFKTFFNDDFIKEDSDKMYVNLEKLSIFNKWILQNPQNVEFYNYSHLLVQKCKHLQYVHNYTIMVSDDVPQNVVQIHCPKCDVISQFSKDDFLKMCRNYEKSSAKFSQGISIYCHKCDTQINFIRLYGNFKVLYGGGDFQKITEGYYPLEKDVKCDKFNNVTFQTNINDRQTDINDGKKAKWNSLQTTFEQFGAIVQKKKVDEDWTYQQSQKWYNNYVYNVSNKLRFSKGERFILDLKQHLQEQEEIQRKYGQNDPGLREIFKYFANQQAQHMDMAYYSGQKFTKKIKTEVDSEVKNLSEDTKKDLNELRQCLKEVQQKLLESEQPNKTNFFSDGINKDKLQKSNYKLLKLFFNENNNYYQTIYFVSNLGRQLRDYKKCIWISRKQIQYISLCHGGIVIKIPSSGKSDVLRQMIETIDLLLDQKWIVNKLMQQLVIFIAVMSKYEKAAYENIDKSKSTLRDDLYCLRQENEQGKSYSFYKTFMQLYYAMLLWDGTDDNPIEVSYDQSGKNIKTIDTLRDTFIKFYEKLKHDVNNKLVYDAQDELSEKPLKDKYLSFLMTLYIYDNQIQNIINTVYELSKDEEPDRYEICLCVIQWVRDFVLYMLKNIYEYSVEELQNVRNNF